MSKFLFHGIEIQHICKASLKNSYISISKDSKVVVKTPKVSKDFVEHLLNKKQNWIRKQLLKLEENKPIKVNLQDEVLLFGKIHSINAIEVKILKDSLQRLRKPTKENILKCYNRFYKSTAQIYLTTRLEYFSSLMNLSYSDIKYKKLKSRWGSCSSSKVITLNTELLKLEKELIDYVVVHELAHLVYMNHSKRFHSLVECYLPNSKLLRQRLKVVNIVST